MGTLRRTRLILHLLYGLFLVLAVSIEGGHRLSRARLGGRWHQRLLNILGVRLHVQGSAIAGPCLIVANHVSWLDIPILGACWPTCFISKADVHHWPIVGWLADAYGSFYLRRGAGGTRALIDELRNFLTAAAPANHPPPTVTLFPEGTTTEGDRLLRFQPRLFACAIEAQCPVQPVALRFGRAANGEDIAPFIGEQTLTAHLHRLLREPFLDAEVIFGTPIPAAGMDRGALAAATRQAIAETLGLAQGTVAGTPWSFSAAKSGTATQ